MKPDEPLLECIQYRSTGEQQQQQDKIEAL
jgi:hypothetical protein